MTSTASTILIPRPVRRRRWVRLSLIVAIVLLIPALLLAFCVGPPSYYRAKYSAAGPTAPYALPDQAIPEPQTEPHTCGLHALSSLYRAYGLDPELLKIRFRLGTDKRLTNLLSDSTGTIHPDMHRVLDQDGFNTTSIDPKTADAPSRLADHLTSGHFAVALIKVTDFHWVLLTSVHLDRLVVCDSLKPEKYDVPLAAYLTEQVHSLILIKPKLP